MGYMLACTNAVQRVGDLVTRLINVDLSRLALIGAGAVAITGGVVLTAGGVVITVGCIGGTKGFHAIHCIKAGGFVSTAGIGSIYVGVGVIKD